MHHKDIFFKTPDNITELFDWAVSKAYDVRVDILTGIRREATDLSYDEYLLLREKSSYNFDTIVHRRGFEGAKKDSYRWCIEVGSRDTLPDAEYFLWIYLDEKYLSEMVSKFKLEFRD